MLLLDMHSQKRMFIVILYGLHAGGLIILAEQVIYNILSGKSRTFMNTCPTTVHVHVMHQDTTMATQTQT